MKFNFRFIATLALLAAVRGAAQTTEDPQRVVALLEYVASDYPRAVQGGKVTSAFEYEEQTRFVQDAGRLARAALGDRAAPGLLAGIGALDVAVNQKQDGAAVARLAHTARDIAVQTFGLRTMPLRKPDLARGATLYAQACVACHGAKGDAATPAAATMVPPPANFLEPARRQALSPYRIYNTVTLGVDGTTMPSFRAVDDDDRWSVAFYVLRLAHAGEPVQGPVARSLAEVSKQSDEELLAGLRAENNPSPEAALSWLRQEAPDRLVMPAANASVAVTRDLLGQAVAAWKAGKGETADRLVLDAYLSGFEPLEVTMRAKDPVRTAGVETGFRDVRAAIARGDGAALVASATVLDRRLVDIDKAMSSAPRFPALAAFLIYFREGVEAALLVGALLAGVRRLGRPEALRYVHAGWISALPAGVAMWWVSERLIDLGSRQRELMEATIALVAAAVLFSMSFWMISKVESKRWIEYLRRGVENSLSNRNLAVLAGLAFLAVFREAAETVLFTQALLLDAAGQRHQVWMGAGAGLVAVAVVAVIMNATVRRLPLGPFFAVSSVLLCGLAISFAGAGMYELVAAGYLQPRPVPVPEIAWMGIHPDLTALAVQVIILGVVAAAGLGTLLRNDPPTPRA